MHLLDSSAIIGILETHRARAPSLLIDQATIDLARYELGNILWKEHTLLRRSTSQQIMGRVNEVVQILSLMNVIELSTERMAEVLELSINCQLSFYDAAYLDTAIATGFTLISEDTRLREAALKLGHSATDTRNFI
jgi:predicted nucleic acid-binding protein